MNHIFEFQFKHLIMNLDPDDVDDDDLDKKPGSGSGASGCSSGYASYTVSEADKVDPGKQPQPPQQQVQGDVVSALFLFYRVSMIVIFPFCFILFIGADTTI